MGYYILSLLYFSIAIGSLMSTAINKKLGRYKCLILGGFGHFTFVFASAFPAYKFDHPESKAWYTSSGFMCTLLIICAIINGFGAAIIWVAEGSYVASCAIPKTKGFFFGFFWVIYMSSQVVGSLIGATILENHESQTAMYVIMSILAFLASLAFVLTREPLVLETGENPRITLQASQLSNVHDYFNNTSGNDSSFQESFKSTFLKRGNTGGSIGQIRSSVPGMPSSSEDNKTYDEITAVARPSYKTNRDTEKDQLPEVEHL